MDHLDRRHVGRDRQQVFAVTGGDRLRLFVEQHVLVQRIADAVHHAAADLAVDQHRVDQPPAIMRHYVAQDPDRAGRAVDLDLADIAAVRESLRARLEVSVGGKPRLDARRHRDAGEAGQPLRDVAQSHRAVGAGHAHAPAVERQVGLGRLQHLGGDLDGLLLHAGRRDMDRRAAQHRDAAADGADAVRKAPGVGRDHAHAFNRHRQNVGGDLGEHRMVALALRRGAGRDHHLAVGLDRDLRALVGAEAGVLDVARDAEAEIFAGGARRRAAGGKIRHARERGVETAMIVAAVIGHGRAVARLHAGHIGEAIARHEARAPHLGAVELQFARHAVGEALQHEGRVGTAGAAHRRGRHLVGEDGVERDVERLQRVGAGERPHAGERQDQPIGHIGAVVVQAAAAHAAHAAAGIGRDLEVPDLVALLGGGQKVLAPVLDPFDRTADLHGGERDRELLGVDAGLGPEPAADLRGDHADPALVDAEELRQRAPHHVGGLGRAPDEELARNGILGPDHAAALHGVTAAAVLGDALAKHMRGAAEHLIDVAEFRPQRRDAVVGRALVRPRGVRLERGRKFGDRGERIVADLDQAGGILGDRARVGDDQRDGLARIMHGLRRQHVLGAVLRQQWRGRELRRRLAGDPETCGGQHRHHARQRGRGGNVDPGDARMGMRRAHECRMHHAGQMNVVEIAPAPRYEIGVLDARHRRAEIANPHGGLVGGMRDGSL